MRLKSEMKWERTDPVVRARTVAVRKLMRAAERNEDVQVILNDPELVDETGGDPLPVVSQILSGIVRLPETRGDNRDWYSRALLSLVTVQ